MTSQSKSFMDILSCLYVAMVLILSLIVSEFNIMLFILYLVLALPFINSIEHYFAVSLLLSTISYYFVGAYEGICSIYTILMLLIILKTIISYKNIEINRDSIIQITVIGALAFFSYTASPFNYLNGLFRLLYLLILSVVAGNFIRLRINIICEILPKIASVMIIGYVISVVINGSFIDGRLTIGNSVNTNTFGMSCAQLSCIMLISAFLNKHQMSYKLILCILIVSCAVLSGSRGALLAFFISSIFVIICYSKKRGCLKETMLNLTVFGGLALCGILIIILSGLDTSRFSIDEIISSGGSRRTIIYESLFTYIIENDFWKIGYGPGHECSHQVIIATTGWDNVHSHNTFLESFGELGIIGFLMLTNCIYFSISKINNICGMYKQAYIVLTMFICLLINGVVESYFCDAVLWLLMAVCRNDFIVKSK